MQSKNNHFFIIDNQENIKKDSRDKGSILLIWKALIAASRVQTIGSSCI